MYPKEGGLSSEELQRKTAAEIARKKVLAAIANAEKANASENSSYKQTPIQAQPTNNGWQNYHSAWQNYYQKYYSEYYAKAARQYLENEKIKNASRFSEINQPNTINETISTSSNSPQQFNPETFREKIRRKADEDKQKIRKHRKIIPIAAGVFVMLLLLFLQYNRLIFAPIMAYVSPGNSQDVGITEIDPTVAIAVNPNPTLLIPKLNVDVPIAFGISNDSATVMEAMNHGVAQFAIPGASALPGEIGNMVITGHSAGDIYSDNQYKFIFSGLERLIEGDLIYVDYNKVRYTYSITKKDTVEPSNVSALVYETHEPIITLITCWPLGTSRYRLLVTAKQVNPAPSGAVQSEVADSNTSSNVDMPENEPTFFQGVWNWLIGQ